MERLKRWLAALFSRAQSVQSPTDQQIALRDAELGLMYAAEEGKDLPENVVSIMEYRRAFDEDPRSIPARTEAEFWSAAAAIAKVIKPTRMEALREKKEYDGNCRGSTIRTVTRRYIVGTWTVLVTTVLMHVLYAVIDGYLARADQSAKNFDAARAVLQTIQPPPRDREDGWEMLKTQRWLMCAAARAWITELERIAGVIPQGDPWYLSFWADAAPRVGAPQGATGVVLPSVLPERDEGNVHKLYHCPMGGGLGMPDNIDPHKANLAELEFGRRNGLGSPAAWRLKQAAEGWRSLLTNFVLPFLYGLLGAMACIVRDVSLKVNRVEFVPTSRVLYALRLPLGALAGATAGLLFDPQTLASLEGVTSLGIAFGLGYGVEVFFGAIDGLIRRLMRALPPDNPPDTRGPAATASPAAGT